MRSFLFSTFKQQISKFYVKNENPYMFERVFFTFFFLKETDLLNWLIRKSSIRLLPLPVGKSLAFHILGKIYDAHFRNRINGIS